MYGTGQTREPQKCLTAIKQTLPQPFHNILILSFFIIQFQALYINFSLLKMRIYPIPYPQYSCKSIFKFILLWVNTINKRVICILELFFLLLPKVYFFGDNKWSLFIFHILIYNSTWYVQYICVHLIPLFFQMYLFPQICLENSLYCFPFAMNKPPGFNRVEKLPGFQTFTKGLLTMSFSFSSGDLTLVQCYYLIYSSCSNF